LDEGIWLFEAEPIFWFLHWSQDLLREVVVDESSFEREVVWRVDGISFVLRRLLSRFAHGQQIEF